MYRELKIAIKYIIIYVIVCSIIFFLCYIDLFIKGINIVFQIFLINFFNLLSWIVIIAGAINIFPKERYSNKRVWFYVAIMSGIVASIYYLFELINGLIYGLKI